ncbi:hypothetical protein BP5796_04866 [Coleophoma crateriformis]|uniref:SET domain-containing protein n=1 Tax=Coleophoma crateriformis TaxID=565419 RepID=A0A3D8SAL8_9HELO|nr:hypothetical protein BP5796_04866 [Coleophoma crateriformis]
MDPQEEERTDFNSIVFHLRSLARLLGSSGAQTLDHTLSQAPAASTPYLRLQAHLCDNPSGDGSSCVVQCSSDDIVLGQLDLRLLQQQLNSSIGIASPVSQAESPHAELNEPASTNQEGIERSLCSSSQPPEAFARRKAVGGLRLGPVAGSGTPDVASDNEATRRLQPDSREFPKRKSKKDLEKHTMEPTTLDKFINGVWKQLHSNLEISISDLTPYMDATGPDSTFEEFRKINELCLKTTKRSRAARALEIVVQAHWVDCFDARVRAVYNDDYPKLSAMDARVATIREACSTLQWSEKELRNRLGIWRGYKEIKDAGGWVPLIFAGNGIYRFCKYRTGFLKDSTVRFNSIRSSLEVAADTLHPGWRQVLSVLGASMPPKYHGHPHDWVMSTEEAPRRLRECYPDQDFQFEHIEESVLDQEAWGDEDPRRLPDTGEMNTICSDCRLQQSDDTKVNRCCCFPELFGDKRAPCPVQIFRTANGRNNGLIARSNFERGTAVGEFVGLITKSLRNIDSMQGGTGKNRYQIYQGKQGTSLSSLRGLPRLSIAQYLLNSPNRKLHTLHQPLMQAKLPVPEVLLAWHREDHRGFEGRHVWAGDHSRLLGSVLAGFR